MEIKYFTDDAGCYLKNIIKNNINFRIIKKEIQNNNLIEIVEIHNSNEDLIKELLNSTAIIGMQALYSNNKILIFKVRLIECKTIAVMKDYFNKKNIIEEKIESNYNVWTFDLNNLYEILNVKKKFIEITGNNVYIKMTKNYNKDIKLLPILKEAYELGYFDVPKRINLIELSKILDITPTKLNLIIRKILKTFLKENLKY